MGRLKNNNLYKFFLLLFVLVIGISCARDLPSEVTVYHNDFETADLTGISNGALTSYNGSTVLGRYNNSNFSLKIDELPKHELVEVSFDLYIHDSWDGNNVGDFGRNGPDIWEMWVSGNLLIRTTFSNVDCGMDYFCNPQSYPFNYLHNTSNPKTGAYRKDLPGACLYAGQPGLTSQYKIVKRIRHNGRSLVLQCKDELVQTNTADEKCDESWSIDNLVVKVIKL